MILKAEVLVAAPPEAVWARLVDPETWPLVIPGLKQAEVLGPLPLAAGSRARFTLEQGGRRYRSEAEVTTLQPPSTLGLHNHVAELGLDVRGTLTLTPEGDGTRLGQAVTLSFGNPLARALGEGLLRAQDPEARLREGLVRLKQRVEEPG